METGRFGAGPGMGRAPPAAARLADVVRRAWRLPAKSLVRQSAGTIASQHTGRDAAARAQSVPRQPAAICPRPTLRISVYHLGGTSRLRQLVEARGERRISAGDLAGKLRSPVTYQAQPLRGSLCGA